jgi:hypothetical protein
VKPLAAASEIDAFCTRCRMDLNHRIVAMVGGVPGRVVCLTCGSEHRYRAPKNDARPGVFVRSRGEPAAPKAKTAAQRVTSKARAEHERYEAWAARTLGQAVGAFTRYTMDQSFQQDQLVLHAKFGEGYVEQVLEDGKVSIMFRDGRRILAHRLG